MDINKYKSQIDGLVNSVKKDIEDSDTLKFLQEIKVKYFGKKGSISTMNKELKDMADDLKKDVGEMLSSLRDTFNSYFDEKEMELKNKELEEKLKSGVIDVSLPSFSLGIGAEHVISKTIDEAIDIFRSIGFNVVYGPEIETVVNNFEKLNIPESHPARDSHDSLYVDSEKLLRTHTSTVQVRTMLENKPPIRIIAPGKVYRNDYDATHSPMFHQLEGLVVDRAVSISMAELKGMVLHFLREMFQKDIDIRLRSSYFPFTEPSAEVDMTCVICGGSGCNVCKQTGWIEVLGCGMVNPKVLNAVGINPDEYSGYAWGIGIERIAMIKYRINDLRLMYNNNIDFLKQFRGIV